MGEQTNIFRIDDGAYHWVIATDAADALAVWRDHLTRECLMPGEDIDETPSVERLDEATARRHSFYEDDQRVSSMWEEWQRDPSRRYVGCSEW